MTAPTRQLRDAFESLTAEVGDIDAMLFTTFGLAVEFFEESVLAPLAVDQVKLSSAQDVFGASEYCEDANVAVFFDANVTDDVEKRVTFRTYPVFVDDGAFHPKIIVVSGTSEGNRVVKLLVSSANLSLAGWARNREVFATVDIVDAATAQPLLELLDYLFETQQDGEAELRDRYRHLLDYLGELAGRTPDAESPRLHVTIPERTNSLMADLADRDADALTIYSPYFGKRPFEYLRKAASDGSITVVAAQDEEGRLPIPKSEVNELVSSETPNLQLARVPDSDGDDEYRFDHFKAYDLPGSVIVGSHNATPAALGRVDGSGHQNVEVSLELPGMDGPSTEEFAERPVGTPEEELSDPEDEFEARMPTPIAVTADWREDVYEIELGAPMPECVIELPGIDDARRLDASSLEVPFGDRAQVELLERKWFEVYRRTPGRERIYRGLVNERHWRTYRREAVLDSLTACFDAWVAGTVDDPTAQEEHLVSASERLLADSERRAKPLRSETLDDDLFQNYFRFFRAAARYWERLERALERDDPEGCVRLIVSAPGSLERVVELTERQIERDGDEFWSVYRFVLVHEMERMLRRLRERAGDVPQVVEVVEELAPRIETLTKRFEDHPAWRGVQASDDIRTAARFVVREMGYADD